MTKLILSGMALALLPCSAADTGRLKTEVNPGRAGVFIDGTYLGPAANFKIARTLPRPEPGVVDGDSPR